MDNKEIQEWWDNLSKDQVKEINWNIPKGIRLFLISKNLIDINTLTDIQKEDIEYFNNQK